MLSYTDRLSFGITADRDSTPDVDVLVSALQEAMDALVAAAREPVSG